MRIAVICNSKTGFSKRYADWIADEISCCVQPYKDLANIVAQDNEIVIFCSRVHAGKIEYLDRAKSHFNNRSRQTLIVVATGATPVAAEKAIDRLWANNLSDIEIKSIPHFYLQGGLNYEKMGFVDRTIMKMVSWLMSRKRVKNDEEAGFEQAIKDSYDISSKEHILPLLNYIKDIVPQSNTPT